MTMQFGLREQFQLDLGLQEILEKLTRDQGLVVIRHGRNKVQLKSSQDFGTFSMIESSLFYGEIDCSKVQNSGMAGVKVRGNSSFTFIAVAGTIAILPTVVIAISSIGAVEGQTTFLLLFLCALFCLLLGAALRKQKSLAKIGMQRIRSVLLHSK